MKKVIITKDNYEEVMFNLLENEYPKDVRENLLDQIQADTFLSFEWKQWSKAQYSEGIEAYKRDEAEFIESLIKEDSDRKGFWFTMYKPMAIAASFIILLGVSIVIFNNSNNDAVNIKLTEVKTKAKPNVIAPNSDDSTESIETITAQNNEVLKRKFAEFNKSILETKLTQIDTMLKIDETAVKEEQVLVSNEVKNQPVLETVKKSRYKITIAESDMTDAMPSLASVSERRYTMADVLSKKDGISLSKFLDNAKTKIIEDKTNHITYIEYIAADMSVLVVQLSN